MAQLPGAVLATARRMINSGLRSVGLEVRRVDKSPPSKDRDTSPPLVSDALEAFYFQTGRGGTACAFQCPVNMIVKDNGFRYSSGAYEPSTLTLIDYIEGKCTEYSGSHIERYYAWREENVCNAADNLLGVSDAPRLQELPPYVAILPWDTIDARSRQIEIERTMIYEYERHGRSYFDVNAHVPEKGHMEFERCVSTLRKISTQGFRRTNNEIAVTLLKRDDEYRFLLSGEGKHRTVAMAALREPWVPACFHGAPRIVRREEAEYWPQVRNNDIWPLHTALAYFDHLFDFDSRQWAQEQGLL